MRLIFFLHVYYKMTRYISKTNKQTKNKQTNKQTKTRERLLIRIINGYSTQQSWSLIMPGMESARYLQ